MYVLLITHYSFQRLYHSGGLHMIALIFPGVGVALPRMFFIVPLPLFGDLVTLLGVQICPQEL